MLSVCVITYNHESYIRLCLQSIVNQKTDFIFEIIIGEDCSTDGTRGVVQEVAEIYPDKIHLLLHNKNVGAIANFLDTLQSCIGKYIALCEGDDYWTDPYKLQKQVDFLESHGDYSGCAHQAMVLVGDKESRFFRQNIPNDISVHDIVEHRLFHTASVVFRRTVLDLYINAPTVLSGDRLLNFCIAFSGKIRFFDDCMCVYRKHDSGMSSTVTMKQLLLDLNSISYLKNIYPSFPKYRYMSYVYSTVGLLKNGPLYKRLYYLFLSLLFSFSYFPNNISFIFKRLFRVSSG